MKRVLVVDDNNNLLHQMVMYLESREFETYKADNGKDAIQIALDKVPDLIICDVMMPDIDGYQVLQELRKVPATQAIPFIFISALNERQYVRRGMIGGADDYLTKPFKLNELEQAIDSRLNLRRSVEEKYDTRIQSLRNSITYALPHELRTPLLGILGYGGLMADNPDQLTPTEIKEYAEGIVRSGERLHSLIENYLIYAQLEIVASDAEQANKMRAAISKSQPTIEKHALEIAESHDRVSDLALHLQPIAVRMSDENMAKIVRELVDNAFKFSPAGLPVEIDTYYEAQQFKLAVRDHGRGMDDDALASIGAYMQFERTFYEHQGLGLGLAIVLRLIDLHNGTIHVMSKPDQGTLVEITLPLD